jgi:transcriptional regulator MraZ
MHSSDFKIDAAKFGWVFSEMDCAIFDFVAKMWDNVEMVMSGFFFSGSHVVKLDEKGRFVLPQNFRYGLVEEGKCEFVIGLGLGGCLTIYRKSLIQKIVDKFKENQHVAKFQKFFTLFFSTLHQTECDKIGRVMLPVNLKGAVGIEKEIVVAGVMDKIELWPKKVYDRNLRALMEGTSPEMNLEKMTEEAFALLHENGVEEVTAEEAITSAMNPAYFKD